MFQARSEWRHIRLIFDHAEGPLIRFAYSLSWVLCSNYHNCCAKHACLYGRRSGVSVCREEGIPAPNPLNAGWMAGPAGEGDEGEGRDAGPTHSQWQARAAHSTEDTGAPQDRISPPTLWPPHSAMQTCSGCFKAGLSQILSQFMFLILPLVLSLQSYFQM